MKKEPLFVVYSDIHHNIWNNFNEGDRRIKESLKIEKEIHLNAKRLGVPKLFIGDLLHNERHISNKLFSYILPHFKIIFGKNEHPTLAISGNHDQSEQNTPDHKSPSYVETLSNTFNGIICLDFKSTIYFGCTIHGIPYLTHDIGLYESIKKIKLSKGDKNILMLHTSLPGAVDTDGRQMESLTIGRKTMKLLRRFDLVLVGHIHKPMKLGKNILQVGATNQQRKTDKGSKLGYWVVYQDNKGKLSWEFKPIKASEFIELEHGEEKPDNKNFYYNKEKVIIKKSNTELTEEFSNVNDRKKLAKSYMKAKAIEDKSKRQALIKAINDAE